MPGEGHGAKLEAKRQAAILALLQTGSVEQAAQTCKIGTATLSRWLRQVEFRDAYHKARQQVFEAGLAKLATLTRQAVQALETIMNDPLAKGSAKVAAARCVLETAMKSMGVEEDDDQSTPPPPAPPTLDLSKLTDEEWKTFKALRMKCVQYSTNTPHPPTE